MDCLLLTTKHVCCEPACHTSHMTLRVEASDVQIGMLIAKSAQNSDHTFQDRRGEGGVDQANHRSRGTSGRQRTALSAYDGAYQNVRKKSPRCVVPGELLRNPSRRDKSGKILETWFGKPSDSQAARSMLSSPDAKMKKKLLRDALLSTGLLQHDNGRNTVNPGEPIHHH